MLNNEATWVFLCACRISNKYCAMSKLLLALILVSISIYGCSQNGNNISELKVNTLKNNMKLRDLTTEEELVIIHKGTERPFTGKYNGTFAEGMYVCRQCGTPLYKSSDKFKSECGWPSFDDEIAGAVTKTIDADGRRTEITCAHCGGHLGHVFVGEQLTSKNTRHCVNSVSLEFIPASEGNSNTETAIFAGGCFWGVEYYMRKLEGVISTEVGYIGGHTDNPTYKEVCSHSTGHAEAIRVVFDPSKTSFESVAILFFEIHDPTQINRQGPDVGDQYRSEVFYVNDNQKNIANTLIKLLQQKGIKVVTNVTKATTFWKAEDYHQNYYEKEGSSPYCHKYVKRF